MTGSAVVTAPRSARSLDVKLDELQGAADHTWSKTEAHEAQWRLRGNVPNEPAELVALLVGNHRFLAGVDDGASAPLRWATSRPQSGSAAAA